MNEFDLPRVKKLVDTNQILSRTFERTTKKWNRGEASYRAIFNALIKNDKTFLALYEQTV